MDLTTTLTSLQNLWKATPPLYLALALALFALTATIYHIKSQPSQPLPSQLSKPLPSNPSKTPPRPPVWPPSPYTLPTPSPYPNWTLTGTKPLPYRPFRYGPKYHTTMGLRTVAPAEWIELDSDFPKYHADKARRIAERGPKCCKTAPEAWGAAVELLSELREYLPARYPGLYKRTEAGLENLWSGERIVTVGELREDPMVTCGRLVQDDLAIMMEREDGQYYLLAGAILLPGFWRLEDKFGMGLSEIHTSGDVPQFRERLEKGMMNFFRRVKPEEMVARNNYFLQVDDDLAWSWSIGSEDSEHVSWGTAEKNRAIEHHHFRSERQTFRRLPKSGGVVFTIRTYFHPITEIVEEDYVPGRLASAIRSWGDDVSRYKGKERYGEVLLEYLDKKHDEQVKRGLDLSREDEVRAYPY
ncbi:hypothetical protein B0T25DRAFT_550448 [Lasiosphaeria hispida]|uniref:Alpha-1,2-mannosyltransferase n=1 Tax=Lasiosphaeria hispida TaxID=260671 RepID=A0AAJ0HA89_9PEZI|nr:hypothetical protein B0T25DRAFT_550448 [Lasiosphaeria hispida]